MSVLKGKLHRLKQRKTSAGKHDEDLGLWKLENFELCPTYCELRYQSPLEPGDYASKPSRHSPGFQVCGYIIGSTEVRRGPRVMLDSSSANENDGLQKRQAWVYMFEVIFFIESVDRIEDHTVVLGHVDQGGREKWVKAIESLIQERRHMSNGFDSFFSNRQALDREEREWIEKRDGRYVEHINRDIWKQARLRNGKVFKDLEKVFVKYSKEETEMTAAGHEFKSRRMALGDVLVALDELGINYFGPNGARLLERIKRHQRLEDEAAVERDKFVEIFKWCFEDRTRPPSAEMKEKLVDIMDRSANVFLTLLTPDEKVALVEGEDAAGVPNCTVQTWAKGSVVVKQGDEGDSMYCVVEGELSVVVSFGSTDKEVAVLGPGGVVGEMSLVFGKARSATCVVHSAECIVAEIRHNVMDALLRRRPMLQRELYEISLQREMANNRTKATTVLDSDFGLPDPAADRPPPPAPRPAPQKRLKPHPGRFGPSVGGPRERLAWIAQCGRAGLEMESAERDLGWPLRAVLEAPPGTAPPLLLRRPAPRSRPASASASARPSPATSPLAVPTTRPSSAVPPPRRPSSPAPRAVPRPRSASASASAPGPSALARQPLRPASAEPRRRLRPPAAGPGRGAGGRGGGQRQQRGQEGRTRSKARQEGNNPLMHDRSEGELYKVHTAKWIPTGRGLGFKVSYD